EGTFRRAVGVAPKSLNAQLALGNFYWSTRRLPEAERAFKAALAIQPADPLANHALAMLYATTNRLREAEPHFVALAADAQNHAPKLMLADYYIASDRAADAVTVLQPLTKDATSHTAAIVRLAGLEYAQGHHDTAHARVNELLSREPSNAEALITSARFLLLE